VDILWPPRHANDTLKVFGVESPADLNAGLITDAKAKSQIKNRKRLSEITSGFRKDSLFFFYRILGRIPFVPATFENFDILETCACELPRYTGAGSFVRSGAVENNRFVLRIFGNPLRDFFRQLPPRTRYFPLRRVPVMRLPHVDYDNVRVRELFS
jgi:hypothetical protein